MIERTTVQVRHDLPWLPPGSTASIVVSDELPALKLVTAVHVLAFDGDAVLFVDVRSDGRGWSPPGGHRKRDEDIHAVARREVCEEADAIVGGLRPFGYEHIRRGGSAEDSPYPYPDSYQVFLLARVERLEPFAETDEVAARALLSPTEARKVRWVRDHRLFYETALTRVAEPRQAHGQTRVGS